MPRWLFYMSIQNMTHLHTKFHENSARRKIVKKSQILAFIKLVWCMTKLTSESINIVLSQCHLRRLTVY